MQLTKLIKVIAAALAGLAFVYVLFNWTMSTVIHSREEVMVPDLKGRSLNDAMTLLSPYNLGLRKEGEEFDQNVPAGTILRQNPLPGMIVREGKIVRVTLSQGGETTFVPDLTGQLARSAEISIRSAGLSLGEESSRFSILAEKGKVLSQDPAPGSIADKDALVNLVISAGPPAEGIILVPKWVGSNVADARAWAEKNRVTIEVREQPDSSVPPGTVLHQEPAPDGDITVQKNLVISVAAEGGAGITAGEKFYYEIPQGGEDRHVRLMMLDENGEHEIFQGTRSPGSKLEIPINPQGNARVRVFINNVLVEEREVK